MQGKIEQVRDSKSGKTLSVLINDQWYSSKGWELKNMVGQVIVFDPSTSEFNGTVMHWLNDYTLASGTTPADAAMQAAMAQPAGNPAAPPTPPLESYTNASVDHSAAQLVPNKEAVIGAMALCKCCTPADPEQVFQNYVFFYHKLNNWDPTVPF